MTAALVPLRIPGSWAVLHNAFRDEEPVVQDGRIVNFGAFGEDLLSIERVESSGAGSAIVPDGHVLDLGWYPDADPTGQYRLTLIRGDWNHVVAKFASRNREKIRGAVERCLAWVASGVPDEEISRRLTERPSLP